MPNKNVLVTGSSGTIGTLLCNRLNNQGYEVTGLDYTSNRYSELVAGLTVEGDLRNKETLEKLPKNIDLIIHLAANARVHRLVQNPELALDNFNTTFNILEYARKNDADIIFGSSREVYGNKGKLIYEEADTFTDQCESPYTASKVGGEALINSYQNCYSIDSTIMRFSNVYGKYDASDRVIPLFIAKAMRGEDLTVYGRNKILDFTYIEDCIDGIMRLVENFSKASNLTFNIASGEGTSLVELAKKVRQEVNSDISIQVEPTRTGEVSRYIADITKAEKVLGYSPSYSFSEGIEETITWYQNNQQLLDQILD